MGFITKWFVGLVSLATAFAVVYTTWRIYNGNGFELAALYFSAVAILRSVLLAWLKRQGDVSVLFRSKTTAFIKTPLEEAAFLLPIYAIPGLYTGIGFFKTLVLVPIAWFVLRALVRAVLEKSAGKHS